MKFRRLWAGFSVVLWMLGATSWTAPAYAQGQVSVIHLHGGGTVRGEIVVDIPGKPLTVLVGNQTLELPRESIERIDPGDSVAPQVASQTGIAAGPVAAAPVAPEPGLPATQAAPAPTTLTVDRRGRAEIDSSWSPEIKQLVTRRNEVTFQLRRKGYTGAIIMMGVGVLGYVMTAVGSKVALASYEECLTEKIDTGSLDECSDASVPAARAGYAISSGLFAGGAVFFWLRWWRKHRLRTERMTIDQTLRRFNIAPLASRRGETWVGGAALRSTF